MRGAPPRHRSLSPPDTQPCAPHHLCLRDGPTLAASISAAASLETLNGSSDMKTASSCEETSAHGQGEGVTRKRDLELGPEPEKERRFGGTGAPRATEPNREPVIKNDPPARKTEDGDDLSEISGSDDLEEEEEEEEEEEVVSLVLSDDSGPRATEDESHYITTHEIQLSELSDHEGDYDLGVGSSASWDVEDASQVYSFVDYSFRARQPRAPGAAAPVGAPLEGDPCARESASGPPPRQQQSRGGGAGQIHLSIRTTSRAINDPGSVQERDDILHHHHHHHHHHHARRSGDAGRHALRGVDGSAETPRDAAKCLVAAPGRVHFGGRLRGKEVAGCSSGTSSAVSELDDADKEVRNLTARAFKSLACPYLDAINFSTSSESSASERGLGINTWSAFVDLKYGNVNVSGLDQSLVSCQNSSASLEIAKNLENRGCGGVALANAKPPSSKIFTLKGSPRGAASSTQKIQLMGKFAQGHGGVIRLTETLNFRCNVKSGVSGGERRAQFAQNAAGSRSADEVTSRLPGGRQRGASGSPLKAMEDAHKKAIFASSLIKNVISKKMQFEQEQKMERGEISEPHQTPSPCFTHQESDAHRGRGGREPQAQSSKLSEGSSDHAIVCLDELGDIVDGGSCDARSDSWRKEAAPASESNLEPRNEAGIDAKKGALDASRSTLLRSQNSAFRCWKDEELRFQKDHKSDQTLEDGPPSARDGQAEGDQGSTRGSKPTKMSHLFVPSIQLLSSDGEAGQQLRSGGDSRRGEDRGVKLRSDNTLYITDSRNLATSKSPEIKINLRSVRENKAEPFGVSKLRAPNIDSRAPGLIRADDFKCQALAAALKGESADKVPHFMVRDIRDNKGKLQTPIHQVRDVRKLVKSSYHFVSLDNNENKSTFSSADSHLEQNKQMHYRNPNSVSPIVIKCQSVNTNNTVKQSENPETARQEPFDADVLSPEGATKSAPPQRAAGRAPVTSHSSVEGSIGLRIESKVAPKKQEKTSEVTEKKPESKMANQAALEKLQAAVKTMEQLYVFEKNEWKRKREPQPLMDSHVLSLIASEEQGPEEEGARGSNMADKAVRRDSYPNVDKTPASPSTDGLPRREDRDQLKSLQTSSGRNERPSAGTAQAFSTTKASTTANTPQTPFSNKTFVPKSPKLPLSLKISQTSGRKQLELKDVERFEDPFSNAAADSEEYLTIPVKSHLGNGKQLPPADKTSVYTFAPQSRPTPPPAQEGPGTRGPEDHNPTTKRSSIVMETHPSEVPPATIYHSLPLGMSAGQPQMYCFSPVLTPAPSIDPFQATQRKMLLDPTTGNYYLVDTPVQPATKRLFDPETGQYVDVPMPQPPMTPVPVPISPLALSPGAYGQTYMIYPGLMAASSMMPSRTLLQSQMAVPVEAESGEKAPPQQAEGMYMESPFYMATGKSPQAASGAQQQAAANRPAHGFSAVKQPVISITSQQGPRIVAPPSFDGTTMSFVVEHR